MRGKETARTRVAAQTRAADAPVTVEAAGGDLVGSSAPQRAFGFLNLANGSPPTAS